jgi:hypothetical protein
MQQEIQLMRHCSWFVRRDLEIVNWKEIIGSHATGARAGRPVLKMF